MNDRIEHLRKVRNKVDSVFISDATNLFINSGSGIFSAEHVQRQANLALIGGRLDKLLRDEIASERVRRQAGEFHAQRHSRRDGKSLT